MSIKWFVKAPVSEYTDKDGTTKKRYQTVGIVTETKKGDLMLKLEVIPLLGLKEGSFWAYLNKPEEKPADGTVSRDVTLGNIKDDEIPF